MIGRGQVWQPRFAFIDVQRIRRFWTSGQQRIWMANSQTVAVLYIILAKFSRSKFVPRLFVLVALWLLLCLTGDRFPLFQKSRHAVGVPFVRVVAERMTKFVADREIEKVRRVHVPLQQQFAVPHRYLRH
jgi:hypothetical protein